MNTLRVDEVHEARNEVIHFESEGVEPEKLRVLRGFAWFLQSLSRGQRELRRLRPHAAN